MDKDLEYCADELVGMAEAMAISSLSDKTIDRKVREGTFPAKVKIGRRTAFVLRELHKWVKNQIEERDNHSTLQSRRQAPPESSNRAARPTLKGKKATVDLQSQA